MGGEGLYLLSWGGAPAGRAVRATTDASDQGRHDQPLELTHMHNPGRIDVNRGMQRAVDSKKRR
jgi:hypothetical protein